MGQFRRQFLSRYRISEFNNEVTNEVVFGICFFTLSDKLLVVFPLLYGFFPFWFLCVAFPVWRYDKSETSVGQNNFEVRCFKKIPVKLLCAKEKKRKEKMERNRNVLKSYRNRWEIASCLTERHMKLLQVFDKSRWKNCRSVLTNLCGRTCVLAIT